MCQFLLIEEQDALLVRNDQIADNEANRAFLWTVPSERRRTISPLKIETTTATAITITASISIHSETTRAISNSPIVSPLT